MSGGVTPAWTLIIVPPTARASTKRVGVRMRTVRMFAMLIVAVAAVSWSWVDEQSTTAAMMAERLAEQEQEMDALNDSLLTYRTASLAERAAKSPPADMIMPVAGTITSRFSRSRFHPILQIFRAHRGVDLSAPAGTRIVAPAAGTVASVGRRFGFGLTVEVVHSGGIVTRYAHCRSALVKRGDQVAMGQPIATVGASGLATAPHLHFEVLVHGTAVDPLKFVAGTHTSPASAATAAVPASVH
jgi:murein DD-endopeptidase MepM/ murein hydrolase activator NlpD